MHKNSESLCWMDGEIIPAEQASISVLDHGLLYGDGVFEGIRFYRRSAFYLAEHLKRLQDSARAICLEVPISNADLKNAIEKLISAFPTDNGYLRVVVTRGVGELGISPDSCKSPTVFIIVSQLAMVSSEKREHGVRLITASTRRLPMDGLDPRIKSLNYLNHILARIEANHANADEAIVLNQNGYIAEGTADNIFLVKNEKLLTPPVNDGALAGVTRHIILDLATRLGIDAVETSLTPYDAYTADECFLTGTAAELIPVVEIDGRQIENCPGSIYQLLKAGFEQRVLETCLQD